MKLLRPGAAVAQLPTFIDSVAASRHLQIAFASLRVPAANGMHAALPSAQGSPRAAYAVIC